jgi:hypothetical protein
MMCLDFEGPSQGVIGGAANGVGSLVYVTDDGAETLRPQDPISNFFWMGAATTGANASMIAGLSMGTIMPGFSYSDDGETWKWPAGLETNLGCAFQDAGASLDNAVMVSAGVWNQGGPSLWGDGIAISYDNGATIEFRDAQPPATSRYSSFINATHGYISGGNWGSSSDEFESNEDSYHLFHKFGRIPGAPHNKFFMSEERAKNNDWLAFVSSTEDGGHTWRNLYFEVGEIYFNKISCPDFRTCFVVGEGNDHCVILRSQDAGETWNEVHRGMYCSLLALDFVDGSIGVAGGTQYDGRIPTTLFLHTYDGGDTWAVSPGSESHPYIVFDLVMSSPTVGYAMALNSANSALLKYTA